MDNLTNPQLKQIILYNKLLGASAGLGCSGDDLEKAAEDIKPYAARLLAEAATITEGDALDKLRGDIAFLGGTCLGLADKVDELISEFNNHLDRGHFS
jgi:hypothetical protein